jgi:hypothetical protein
MTTKAEDETKAKAVRPTTCSGTIHSRHIEEPKETFYIWVCRAPCFNVFLRPARWEMWKVLAETAEGAIKIAKYHFHNAQEIQFIGEG